METSFKEGEKYKFKVLKVITLPDDKDYYMLEDPIGRKHLMVSSFYKAYGIHPGTSIECKIDRINCNGKIFLEPKHPYLEEMGSYTFTIEGTEEIFTGKLDTEQTLFLRDSRGMEHIASADISLNV
ncbi:MAG: hypothetical protein ABIJ16_11930, partial [Bacteroidota bacterium]